MNKMTLEERVAALEASLDTLTNNVGLNNTDMQTTLQVIANKSADSDIQEAVANWILSTCPRNPPGCR
jgi:hypothetical protein